MAESHPAWRSESRCPEDIAEAAAVWLARRDRGFSAAEAAEFVRWQAADPRHAAEFAQLETEWRRMDLARDVPELAALARELETDTRRRAVRRGRAGLPWWSGLLAAAAAAGVLAWAGWWRAPATAASTPRPTYALVPNEVSALILADGTVVELRGGSEVRAEFTPAERRVRLLRGEAHFKVTKDPARPFVVAAGPVAVRAVGTAFDVRLEPARVEVLVTEGQVRVARESALEASAPPQTGAFSGEVPVLGAGEHVRISLEPTPAETRTPVVAALAPAEIDRALAWQKSWLVFTRTPLKEAVEAFNRQAVGPRAEHLIVEDAALGERRIGGTFRADNVDGFVRLLEQAFEVRAERRGEREIVLQAAR